VTTVRRGRPPQIIRDGHLFCDTHLQWEPISDFWVLKRIGSDSIYSPRCKLAKQTIRDTAKDSDPARYAIEGRATQLAGDISKAIGHTVSRAFVLVELHWQGLIPYQRAAISPGGTCLNCAKHWADPRKYTLDHLIPPTSITDWAAHHARNIVQRCPGCNSSKGRRDHDRDQLDREHRKWMTVRHWADMAGTAGWPPYEPAFGQASIGTAGMILRTPSIDGTGSLFA
jgi:hypothetical protein